MPETTKKPIEATADEAETKATRLAKKAKLAQVLERGMVNARLEVKDPDPNKHYMWARDEDTSIDRYKSLGYELEHRGKTQGLHDKGDSRIVVGDAVLMSTSMENHDMLAEIKEDQHAKRRNMSAKKEYVRMSKSRNPDVAVLDPNNEGDS